MMCYGDKTFCSFYESCHGANECGRALTKEVLATAERSELLIAQFAEKPECYDEIKLGEKK